MGLEGRGLVLRQGLPIFFFFPLADHFHLRGGQGRWNLAAFGSVFPYRICAGRKKSDLSPKWGSPRFK